MKRKPPPEDRKASDAGAAGTGSSDSETEAAEAKASNESYDDSLDAILLQASTRPPEPASTKLVGSKTLMGFGIDSAQLQGILAAVRQKAGAAPEGQAPGSPGTLPDQEAVAPESSDPEEAAASDEPTRQLAPDGDEPEGDEEQRSLGTGAATASVEPNHDLASDEAESRAAKDEGPGMARQAAHSDDTDDDEDGERQEQEERTVVAAPSDKLLQGSADHDATAPGAASEVAPATAGVAGGPARSTAEVLADAEPTMVTQIDQRPSLLEEVAQALNVQASEYRDRARGRLPGMPNPGGRGANPARAADDGAESEFEDPDDGPTALTPGVISVVDAQDEADAAAAGAAAAGAAAAKEEIAGAVVAVGVASSSDEAVALGPAASAAPIVATGPAIVSSAAAVPVRVATPPGGGPTHTLSGSVRLPAPMSGVPVPVVPSPSSSGRLTLPLGTMNPFPRGRADSDLTATAPSTPISLEASRRVTAGIATAPRTSRRTTKRLRPIAAPLIAPLLRAASNVPVVMSAQVKLPTASLAGLIALTFAGGLLVGMLVWKTSSPVETAALHGPDAPRSVAAPKVATPAPPAAAVAAVPSPSVSPPPATALPAPPPPSVAAAPAASSAPASAAPPVPAPAPAPAPAASVAAAAPATGPIAIPSSEVRPEPSTSPAKVRRVAARKAEGPARVTEASSGGAESDTETGGAPQKAARRPVSAARPPRPRAPVAAVSDSETTVSTPKTAAPKAATPRPSGPTASKPMANNATAKPAPKSKGKAPWHDPFAD